MGKYKFLFFVFLAVFSFVELLAGLTSIALMELFGRDEIPFMPLMRYLPEINISRALLFIQIISIGGMIFCVIKQKMARVLKLIAISVLGSLVAVTVLFLYLSFLISLDEIG